jgi:hypothetical protein
MKPTIERLDAGRRDFNILLPKSSKRHALFPFAILLAMGCAILLMAAVLPLRDLWFHDAMLTQLGSWPDLPSLLLFPGQALIPPLPHISPTGLPQVIHSWEEMSLLLGSFVIVFLIYLLALRQLPKQITRRYLLGSTALLGLLYILIPIVTSSDLYSYITYARIGVIYHMNPLTTLPTAISTDVIYSHVNWTDQPSAYGPTWIGITCFLQWVFGLFGISYISLMVIALRTLGLIMHLASTRLIWSISGHLQHLNGNISPTTRLRATLAFAWNPLLLFEAGVNAHSDTTLLFLVLLAVWFLVRNRAHKTQVYRARGNMEERVIRTEGLRAMILAAAMLALATCLKINIVVLTPGLLFYAWVQGPVRGRIKRVAAVTAVYTGTIFLLYAPFWQGGAVLNVFAVNPATYRSISTLADFLGHFYNGIAGALGFPIGAPVGSPAGRLMHTFSLSMFVIIYAFLCWRIKRTPERISTPQGLICWMAVVWLAYCATGAPWFWPWYMTTFFGLYALLEGSDQESLFDFVPWLAGRSTLFVRLFAFSMFSLCCFFSWGPQRSFVPGLPGFQWSYFSGVWAWVLPVLGAVLLLRGAGALYWPIISTAAIRKRSGQQQRSRSGRKS